MLDVNLTNALIILLDLNLTKYKSKKIANEILPTMIEYMFLGQYKRIASAFLINNFDLFFDSITLTALDQIKEIFRHPNNANGNVFNEWALNKLSHTAALSKFIVNEELLSSIFGELWFRESRSNERNSWLVDLLLASQQKSFEEMQVIIDKDPLNLENSELVNSITDYASLLINHFYEMIKQIIEVFQDRQMRKLDYDCVLYTLISNFFAAAAPVTNCTQLANVMINDKCISIMKMLSEDFEADDTLKSFIGFFDMIYTVSISGLIRGGNTYQCEKDYEWLIHANFNNGSRNLTPDVISDVTIFLSSLQNDFIRNESEDMNYLYSKINHLRSPRREYEIIDRYIMAAVTHQTNTFHLLSERNPDNKISPELRAICNWLRKIRLGYSSIVQNENSQGNDQNNINEKQSDKFLANLGILINLDPVFENYLERNNADKKECLNNLEQFIKNNDPALFHKVLKAIPKRLEYLLCGFSKLNSLFNTVQNRTFQTFIIDGISRVDSFERTGFLLEHAQLDDNALSVLTIFYMTCISLVCDFDRFSVLEILYTVLVSCSYFKQNAIEVMNQLSLKASNDRCLEDPFFMTIAGLARSALTLPQNFHFLPDIAKASIFHLIYTKKNAPTLTMIEIFNFILNNYNDSIIFDVLWIKMIFTVFIKCQDDETGTLNSILQNIFNTVSERLNNKCTVFNTLPEIIYGFRTVLNSGNERSILLQTILASITVDSSIGEIFLLLAIIGGDISDYSMYYAIRNRHGTWFKCTKREQENYLQIPITPLSKGMTFDINEISEPVQDVDLKLEMGLSFETILAFSEVCMRDQGSLLCRLYLQTLSKYISTTNENIPQELLSSLARSAKPYIDFHILSTNQTNLYKHLTSSFNLSERSLPESEFGLGRIEQSNSTHLFAFNIMALGDYAISVTFNGDGYLIIHRMDPIVIKIPSGIINQGDDSISIVNGSLEITVIGEQSMIIVNEHLCPSEPYTYLEFIADSMENIVFNMNRQDDFTNSQICFNNIDNLNVDYSNDIFENVNPIEAFVDDLQSIAPLGFQTVNAQSIEREGKNKPFNNEISDVGFNERLPFTGSSSMYNLLGRKNEFSICNQIKSVILAQAAINDPGSLDWQIAFSLIKSAVVAVGSFSKSKLMSGEFPYQLNEGFFRSCALNYLHNRNIKIFYIALKTLIKSETIMNNLGKQLVIMAQDRTYHSLIHKKDLVYIKPEQIARFERGQNDFVINFADGSKGKIEIDESGSWLIDTPMVLLLLLWIFIDNCTTSAQRICAKLTIVDCMMIKSPMIQQYMPEFLNYIQDKLLFMTNDFNPIYIHHLSTLAINNLENEQIMSFYECEKKCFRSRNVPELLVNNLNEVAEIDFNIPTRLENMIQIYHLLRRYDNVADFPVWYFAPLWKKSASYQYEKYTNNAACSTLNNYSDIFNPTDDPLIYLFTFTDIKVISAYIYEIENDRIELNLIKNKNEHYGKLVLQPNERKRVVWNVMRSGNL